MISKKDIVVGLVVLGIALCTRVFFLGYVSQVVFDEVHFGKFISSYCCTHTRFFDIHPPIGKLIIAGGAYLAGYNGLFPFEYIGQPFTNIPIASIRLVPALFGSLLALIIYILLRQVGVSRLFAGVGGVAIALDNALIVESRLILTDSILLVATFGTISAGIAAVHARHSKAVWWWVILAGVLAGMAMGIKFTGLIAGGLVGILFIVQAYKDGIRTYTLWLARLVLLSVCAAIVYLSAWQIHFSLLTLPGSGDVWGVPTGHFFQDLVSLQQEMLSANYNLTAGHPYGSKWWTWPFMVRPVFYWQGASGSQFIYLLGNPAVWWGAFAFLCMAIVSIAIQKGKRIGFIWVMIAGYLWAYVPLMRVPRVLFLYHYLTPLIFSLMIAIWWVDRMAPNRKKFAIGMLICIALGFLYISPLTYGYPMPTWWQSFLFAIPTWR